MAVQELRKRGHVCLLSLLETHPVRGVVRRHPSSVCVRRKVAAGRLPSWRQSGSIQQAWDQALTPSPSSVSQDEGDLQSRAAYIPGDRGSRESQVLHQATRSCEVLDSTLAPSPSVGATVPLPEGIQPVYF